MKIRNFINEYTSKLNYSVNINDIYRIIAKYFNTSKEIVIANYLTKELTYENKQGIQILLDKYYIENIPLQYIIGYQMFYNEKYIVNENVLIPRADTEILVAKAIEYINKEKINNVIDLCCGSGAIGISIAKNSNVEQVTLIDISNLALEVTSKNIKLNGVEDKCSILQSDVLSNYNDRKVDMLVSNPPYIKSDEVKKLDLKVQSEPLLALDGGTDGLVIYRKILNEAQNILKDTGIILFEIGYNQKEDLASLINNYNCYEYINCIKDLEGRDRVIICRFHQI